MDVENDNELTLIINSYDSEKDQDTSLLMKFDAKGKYAIVTAPKEEEATEGATEEAPADTAPKPAE
jgi:hypothetical protein